LNDGKDRWDTTLIAPTGVGKVEVMASKKPSEMH
jgi:hypothetical protein